MQEIEIKILNVDPIEVKNNLISLGALEVQNTQLTVNWYGPKGLTHDGDDPYFLRVRTYSNPLKHEVTWKGKSEFLGATRKTKEINFSVSNPKDMSSLFEELNLENYAHQEKKRVSWKLNNIKFDLDTYPKMPTYLEIEAETEEEIKNMIKNLHLEKKETWNDGERTLIKGKYRVDWFNMRF